MAQCCHISVVNIKIPKNSGNKITDHINNMTKPILYTTISQIIVNSSINIKANELKN